MKRKIFWIVGIAVFVIIVLMLGCDFAVSYSAQGRMYDEIDSVPHRNVGLVLGTSPVSTRTGRRNYYFDKRIEAASELYKAGKVDWLIVSGGDYRNTEENGFDEPVAMRDSLIIHGVAPDRIILDYDGTRTINSIAKVKDVYRHDSIIIISQEYHNARALYQAKYLGVDAIAYNAGTPVGMKSSVWWYNRGREVLARVKLFMDLSLDVQPDVNESSIPSSSDELLMMRDISTPLGDLVCLKPDMNRMTIELVCGSIPNADNDSIILAFAGSFTGEALKEFKHSNIAGDHVSGGIRYKGYRCRRNTGAFTWSQECGPQFFYKDYSNALDKSARHAGMGFTQEMMIHKGKTVETKRSSSNVNVFRALCQDAQGDLVLFETRSKIPFGKFIEALLSQGVQEALYTDMGPGWNYCFYRCHANDASPEYLHRHSLPYASNFIVLKKK